MEMKEPTVWELMERKKAWDAKKAAKKAEAERSAQEAAQATQEESATLTEILKAEDPPPDIPIEIKAEQTENDAAAASKSGLTHISIELLDKYLNDPFREYTDQRLDQLMESIKEHGILSPIIVRPKPEGRYEILSGRHRKNAALKLGMEKAPCIIKEANDDEAALIVTESNLHQREKLLPSEKAFAYKMRNIALENRRKNSDFSMPKSDDNQENQEHFHDGNDEEFERSGYRYIRLTYLTHELLQLIDEGTLSIVSGEEISYLNEAEQLVVLQYFFEERHGVLDLETAQNVRSLSKDKEVTYLELVSLLRKKKKPSKEKTPTMKMTRVVNHFPKKLTVKQMESIIIKALDYWYTHAQDEEEQEVMIE